MRLATPRWWYVRKGAPAPVARALLRPLGWVWAAVTARRIAHTTPLDPGPPVICVGNLTLGGAGKTPVVRAVLARLRVTGVDAHGLSRGHGGRLAGPHRVSAQNTAAEVGDEAVMLGADGPFWIARDRAAGAVAAATAGAQALVLDDGHQNPALAKALSLIVVDGETREGEWPFGDGQVFPAGPMREPLATGLARADAVVLLLPADIEAPDPELVAIFGGLPVLTAWMEPAAAAAAGTAARLRGGGQAVEGRTRAQSRRLRPGRLRPLSRPPHLLGDRPCLPRRPRGPLRRRPPDHREGLGAPAPSLAGSRGHLASARALRRRGDAGCAPAQGRDPPPPSASGNVRAKKLLISV